MDSEKYFYDNLDTLRGLINIPSVYDESSAAPGMPRGKGVAAALDYMRRLAYKDGFEVLEYDGQALAIRIKDSARKAERTPETGSKDTAASGGATAEPGQDAESANARINSFAASDIGENSGAATEKSCKGRIDIVSHLDVVEPGDGWITDPFCAEVRDGRLYGRGTQDMKTSVILTYLALKRLRDEGVPFKRELRLVLGTDEERTMNDMDYYLSKAGRPDFAFTPDGEFPMAIGEKGALMWTLRGTLNSPVLEYDCGVQCNVISPSASCLIRGDCADRINAAVKKAGIDGAAYLIKTGCSDNGSADAGYAAPEGSAGRRPAAPGAEGAGAAAEAAAGGTGNAPTTDSGTENRPETVSGFGDPCVLTRVEIKGVSAHASRPEAGHSATVDLMYLMKDIDPVADVMYRLFGDLYGSGLGIGRAESDREQFTLNPGVFRMKNGVCYGEIDGRYPFGMTSAELTRIVAENCPFSVSLDFDSAPTMNSESDPYVAALLSAYRDITGDYSEPVVSGGVSYSKKFGHCVAFGPISPREDDLCHQANESVALEDCVKDFEIYYEAMKKLAAL